MKRTLEILLMSLVSLVSIHFFSEKLFDEWCKGLNDTWKLMVE